MTTKKINRRHCIASIAALPFLTTGAVRAQGEWPIRPITLIVPVSPGGVVDIVPRVFLRHLSKDLGQSIVVENKPGADFSIAASAAMRSAPDGYTWLAGSIPLTTNPALRKTQYDPLHDFTAVSLLGTTSVVAVVPPSLGVSTLSELIALAKRKPGAMNYASSANGGLVHLNTELFNAAAGISMTGVLYKGQAPAMSDLLANRVNFMMVSPLTVLGQLQSGALKALAIVGKSRSPLLPDVPTFAELGFPSVDIDSWIGILAPTKTPGAVVARVNAAFKKALGDPEIVSSLAKLGVDAAPPAGPEALRKRMEAEVAAWPKIFQTAGIQPEK